MSESTRHQPRIVTPQEARASLPAASTRGPVNWEHRLVHTVATEPDRTRAAVVKALLLAGVAVAEHGDLISYDSGRRVEKFLVDRAGAIENGADW